MLVRLRVPRVSTLVASAFPHLWQAVWVYSRFRKLCDTPFNFPLMPVESVLMALILKSSDHVTQTKSTQGSTSMNSASANYGAQEDILIAQFHSLYHLYLGICSR